MLDNTTAMAVFGGLKSESTLRWVSTLTGSRFDERVSRQSPAMWSLNVDRFSSTTSLDRTPTLDAAEVRTIPRGRAVLIHRHLRPVMLRLTPAWTRKDWKQLKADADSVRAQAWGRHLSTEDMQGIDV